MPDLNNLGALQERIHLLESENALLTQRTEDTLMLGLVSEAIEQAEDITTGLDAALERMAMLKDLPVVAYCSVNENNATMRQSYVSFSHTDINGFSFPLPEMAGDSVIIDHDHPHISRLYIPNIDFRPKQVLLIPTESADKSTHVFLFASNEKDNDLQQISPVLERIVHIIAMVIENRKLLKSYKELNEELDYRVELRSKALQESEDKYHTLVESSDTAIMLSFDGKFVDCNAATLRLFGCDSKEAFLKLNPIAVSPEFQSNGIDSTTLVRQHIDLAMETGSDRFDWIHKRSNGEVFFTEVHLTRVSIQGQMMVQGVVIDIHDRVLAEKKLHQYKYIVSSSLDMMALLDVHYTYLATNPKYLQMLNKKEGEVIGHSVSEVFGETFFNAAVQPHASRCLMGENVHFQEWVSFPALGLRYMDVHYYPYRNSANEVIGFVMNGRDTTIQMNTEKALQESERQYRELIEHMQDCVYRTDVEGRLVYVSPSIQSLMACEPDELIGDKLSDYYVDPSEEQEFLARLETSPDGKIDCFETQIRRKDGKIIWLSANSHFIYDEDGQIRGVEGSLRDITKLKEMESKFNQAQKMEAVGTLVGGIAHDFNNILAGMVGSFYLIKYKQQNNPELVRDIEALEQQSFRAADMIKQLLTFSRKGEIQTKNFSFDQLMMEVFDLAKRTVPENIMLSINVCKEPLFINGDTSLLQQVLMNLINNSRDAVGGRENPSINITVDHFQADKAFTRRHPEVALETAYARLSIQDNGCGISEEGLGHVFEPFYTTKGVGEGTGLGLAMIYGSIQSHQGFIELDSIVDEGTTVDIFLPVVASDEPMKKNVTDDDLFEGHGEIILCVDDEREICAVNCELLSSFGYQTLEAHDGLEAMQIFKAHKDKIALLLTDVIMPNMGGIELAKELWITHPELPVVFTSGYDENHLLEIPKTVDHISILQKPYSVEALSQEIYHLLKSKLI